MNRFAVIIAVLGLLTLGLPATGCAEEGEKAPDVAAPADTETEEPTAPEEGETPEEGEAEEAEAEPEEPEAL